MIFGSDDFNDVTCFQLIRQRHHASVDFCTGALIADFGMNHISKIDRCRAPRQCFDFSSRRKNINLIGEKIDAHIFHKFARVHEIFLIFHQVLYPGKFAADIFIEMFAFFIAPVSGNTGCGDLIHLPGSDLNLDALSDRPNHRGVQRLIHI